MSTRRRRRTGRTRPVDSQPRRLSLSRLSVKLGVLGAVLAALGALAGGLWLAAPLFSGPSGPPTAAIVDQLTTSVPNPEFVASATASLQEAGYLVDYYPGEEVTVDLYRQLPRLDYDIIVMRAHAGLSQEVDQETGEITGTEYVGLFTGEVYSKEKYHEDQVKGLIGWSTTYDGGPLFYAIGDRFIEESMEGRFDDTLIVMMGCDGLSTQRTAQAFLDKGAKAFVSWTRPVSASHTDSSTQRLLQKLLLDGLSVGEAVSRTAAEVGPDPWYGAELRVLEDLS
ncbi:MAG: hypothetical protein ACE5Q6_22150 [Dehalococcoidia bacterium]